MESEPTVDAALDAGPEAAVDRLEAPAEASESDLLEDELLVEEISIDGMCGVY